MGAKLTSDREQFLVATYPRGCAPPTYEPHWHDWATAQSIQGLDQSQCTLCKRWGFPQEQKQGMCLKHVSARTSQE